MRLTPQYITLNSIYQQAPACASGQAERGDTIYIILHDNLDNHVLTTYRLAYSTAYVSINSAQRKKEYAHTGHGGHNVKASNPGEKQSHEGRQHRQLEPQRSGRCNTSPTRQQRAKQRAKEGGQRQNIRECSLFRALELCQLLPVRIWIVAETDAALFEYHSRAVAVKRIAGDESFCALLHHK